MYYKVGNIELETDAHSSLVNGKAINMTPLEYGLLAYLMQHPNRVCSRTEVLDKVLGQQFQYDTGTVDMHLNALRRKLGGTPNM